MTKRILIICAFFMLAGACCAQEDPFLEERLRMVDKQIRMRGIQDPEVLEAMRQVKRHLFVPEHIRGLSYEDTPLPIGYDQTISQPYIVAYMTELAGLEADDKVLEIGTGSGYQAAVLARMVDQVYTIEIVKPLAESARKRFRELGIDNVNVRWGDGYKGWPDQAPFDAVIVTAAPPEIPEELVEQLKIGGRMVVPVGRFFQKINLIIRTEQGIEKRELLPVRFVPMVRSEKE
ncbi:MAG: protein-L-isoaspartate(D-aspartate) O-methyltransferase [Candidatus Omnitrophica bacterium]|nr:protein-L-isoaspartate(D-aspartate) O-methyltransferase [Candidatus Omnitrophota bacterium]